MVDGIRLIEQNETTKDALIPKVARQSVGKVDGTRLIEQNETTTDALIPEATWQAVGLTRGARMLSCFRTVCRVAFGKDYVRGSIRLFDHYYAIDPSNRLPRPLRGLAMTRGAACHDPFGVSQ